MWQPLLYQLYTELQAKELCRKMPCADILAVIGGLTVAFYLLKLTWRCWCGFREFVLSAKWQVDLRAYGQWAGKAEDISYITIQNVRMPALQGLGSGVTY